MALRCRDPIILRKLTGYAAEREALRQDIVQILADDVVVVAAWLFGSGGRGDADELSDIDIFVVVADDALDEVISRRYAMIERVGTPLLILEAPQNAPPGGAYNMALYPGEAGPHQVDWYWQGQSVAAVPQQTRILFDRVGLPKLDTPPHFDYQPAPEQAPVEAMMQKVNFFWVMLLIAAKYIARSPQEEGVGLAKYCAVVMNEVHEMLGDRPPGEIAPVLPLPEPGVKIEMLRTMAQQMVKLMRRVTEIGGRVPWSVVDPARQYLDLVAGIIRSDLIA